MRLKGRSAIGGHEREPGRQRGRPGSPKLESSELRHLCVCSVLNTVGAGRVSDFFAVPEVWAVVETLTGIAAKAVCGVRSKQVDVLQTVVVARAGVAEVVLCAYTAGLARSLQAVSTIAI